MTEARNLVFLHGAGGPADPVTWLGPLNVQLASFGYSRFDAAYDRVFAPEYLADLLRQMARDEPARTWKPGSEDHQEREKVAYYQRLNEIERVGRTWERLRTDPNAAWLPDGVAEDSPFTQLGVDYLKPVRLYQREPRARWSAQRSVLRQLPKSGSMIVVAHSLGSVVAADLLAKLPPNLRIELLLTVGSPLAIKGLGDRAFEQDFPYDRVGAWVNLYDPGDFVTIGRGVGRRFRAACDIAISTGWDHDAVAYLSNPAAAAVIGHQMFGSPTDGGKIGPASIHRRIHQMWQPLLLSFAYSAQISSCANGEDWRFKSRVDAARNVLAQRAADNVHDIRRKMTQDEATRLDDSPVGHGRYPEASDLLHRAADLARDNWHDDALLSLAVGLAMLPPLHPFDIEISDERRHNALLNTLNRVRVRQGSISDERFAEAVRDGVKAGKDAVAEGGFPWGRVLLGTGVALLALTGVGLAVAAPAGLAGAALITATLAAFGPGGMVGGLVTIATLTGLGAASTGIGVVSSIEDPAAARRAQDFAVEELANKPIDAIRNTVAGVLAVVDAQARLKFKSTAPKVREILQEALDIVQAESVLHDAIAAGRRGTKEWEKKIQLLERALGWLTKTHLRDDPLQKAREEFSALPESMSEVPVSPLQVQGRSQRRQLTTRPHE